MKKEIIVVMKFIPAPAYSGGAKRNLAWLKFLSKYYKVNLIGYFDKTYKDDKIFELDKYDVSIYGFKFKRNLVKNTFKSLFLNKSFINIQYYNSEIKKTLKNILFEKDIAFVMCEELAMMNYCNDLNVPVYFDDHNIEYVLMSRTANYNKFPLNLILKREAGLIKKEEMKSFKKADKIFTVSDADKELIKGDYKDKVYVVNNTYEKLPYISNVQLKKSIVFVGNVSWKPNLHGLNHFISNIFPKVLEKDSDIIFEIIGSSIPKEIKKINSPNINIHENASEKEKNRIIDESKICIVPVYFGGGTRIKILEYWSHYKPVISTTIGAEGLSLSKGTLICDEDSLFANKIIQLINNDDKLYKMGQDNHKVFIKNYCEENVYGDTLYRTINSK